MKTKILSLNVLLDELNTGSFDCLQPQYRNSIIHYLNEHTNLARSEKEARLAKNKILSVLRNKVATPHMQLNKLLTRVSEMKIKLADTNEKEYTRDNAISQIIEFIEDAIEEITL